MVPWVGFDLDGTLAYHNNGDSIETIGDPIPLILALVMQYLNQNVEVRIITARVSWAIEDPLFRHCQRLLIEAWCEKYIGRKLVVTSEKDFNMIVMYDDRCKQVLSNTGQLVEDFIKFPSPNEV